MRLQLAIDSLGPGEAEALISRVRDLVDIVEVGTPIVIRDGVAAVRRLRTAFPDLAILADLKIVDGGHLEASLGFQAGARIVTVLGAAADATVCDVVRAAGEHAGEVMVDLIGVEDLARRAAEVDALGAHYVCLHTGVDVQRGGADAAGRAVEGLRRVREVLRSARLAVAGGLTPANVPAVAALRPDIVIVGSGIARAADPRAAAAAIRAAFEQPREVPS